MGVEAEPFFFDVKIFNPLAKSCPKNSVEAYKYHESLKCLKYEQRILEVEKSNFVPRCSVLMFHWPLKVLVELAVGIRIKKVN